MILTKILNVASTSRCIKYNGLLRGLIHTSKLFNTEYNQDMAEAPKKALVVVAEGSEEIEAVVSIDILRRAGISVTVAGLNSSEVVACSRSVGIKPDTSLTQVKQSVYDVIVLPGGQGGSQSFSQSEKLGKLLKEQEKSGRYIAAICAAPLALKEHYIAFGKKITSYPAMEKILEKDYNYVTDDVVVDGKIITSRGPGTAFKFALTIVENILDKEKASSVAKGALITF